jgi:YesN/AraC family two-component response regulator
MIGQLTHNGKKTNDKFSVLYNQTTIGFEEPYNTSCFCTYFKKIKGISPSEYRRIQRID